MNRWAGTQALICATVTILFIAEAEAKTAVEVFLTGGDTHVYALTHWDNEPVGDACVGPVATRVLNLLENEAYYGTSEHLDVPY